MELSPTLEPEYPLLEQLVHKFEARLGVENQEVSGGGRLCIGRRTEEATTESSRAPLEQG